MYILARPNYKWSSTRFYFKPFMENSPQTNMDYLYFNNGPDKLFKTFSFPAVNAPSNLRELIPFSDRILLTWDHEGEVDEFIIYWRTESGMEYNISTANDNTKYTLRDLTPATMYYISVAAVLGGDLSERSESIHEGTGNYKYCG